METNATSGTSNTKSLPTQTEGNALRNLDLDSFIRLMIVELQNQDPLNPMDNDKILQQISQIHSIESTKQLSETLDSVLLGQNLSNASSLIGRNIKGLADGGAQVSGVVDRVVLTDGVPKLVIGEQQLALGNVGEILPRE